MLIDTLEKRTLDKAVEELRKHLSYIKPKRIEKINKPVEAKEKDNE